MAEHEGLTPVNFTMSEQGVALSFGDGWVAVVSDSANSDFVRDLTPIQRAVAVARLRAVADLIEGAE